MDSLPPRSPTGSNARDDTPTSPPQVIIRTESVIIGDVVHNNTPPLRFDLNKAENRLRECLSRKIRAITDLQESESLPLQVAKMSEPQREAFGRRGWFDQSRNESNSQFYDMHQLFHYSKTHAKERANQKCSCQETKEEYIRNKGNMVGANGIAGIGKTTMVKLMAKKTNLTPPGQKPPLVFFVSFRDIDCSKPCSVLQFLTSSMLSDWKHTPESDEALLERINEADDVHIFTDALDEAREIKLNNLAPKMGLYDTATPDVIFKNLYSGHLLPKARKFLTSRPGAFYDLHPYYKPGFCVTVLGLSKESQDSLCQKICENADNAAKVKTIFKSNPALSSLSFIPMFCRMTILYLLQNIESDIPLLSSTDMLAFSLNHCVRSERFKGDIFSLSNLSKLALDGFAKDKLIFDINDLLTAGVKSATVDAFMNIDIKGNRSFELKILNGDKIYYFSHLLWQEFFSAACLLFLSSDEQFTALLPKFGEYRWYSVVKFMFGLSNPLVRTKMEPLFPQMTSDNLQHKINRLKHFFQTFMLHFHDNSVHYFPTMASYVEASCYSDLFKYLFSIADERLLMICTWVYELQDVEMSKFVADNLPDQIHLRGSILPSDVIHLLYVLKNTEHVVSLSIGTWNESVIFLEEGLKILLNELPASQHKLKKLHVKNQVIDIRDFTHFINDVDELGFVSCNLSLDEAQRIFQVIRRRPTPIEMLDLTENTIVSSAIEDCVQSLPMIRALEFRLCNLSEDFILRLSDAIECLESPMTSFDVSENKIGRRGIEKLSQCIHNIHYLDLYDCKLCADDVEVLANKIAELNEPIKLLQLSVNKIGSSGLRHLTCCLHKIKCLMLFNCDLTGDHIEILASKIKDLRSPMKMLELDGNNIGSAGATQLSRCLHNIDQLWISGCGLSGEDMNTLAAAVLQRDQPMEALQISGNKIEDNGIIAICRSLHNIKLLTINGCNLSEAGIEALLSTNARNEQKCEIFGLNLQ